MHVSRRMVLCTGVAAACPPLAALAEETNVLTRAMAGTAVPGMAAMVIRNFRAEREVVAGVRRLGLPDEIQRRDSWYIGSDAKAMTATLIAVLAERGVLSWQAPLAEMLPELESAMHADYRDVTLPDLLSHRAGLPGEIVDMDLFVSFFDDRAPMSDQRCRYITLVLSQPPAAPKRAALLYSNTGYYVAAAIAERATGREYEDLMQEYVFAPLRMRSISRAPIGRPDEPIGHVSGRQADRFGTVASDLEPLMGAPSHGGIRLSLRDWARFCIDQMHGEHGAGRLMRHESYRFIHAPQADTRYAFGWATRDVIHGRRGPALFHSGSDGNWIAEAVLFPRIGDGVLVVANSAYGMDGNTVSAAVVRELCQTLSEPV